MTDGAWETGASAALVAAEFGVSVRTVETWASMASRAIRMAIGDGEELRARLAMMLERHERVAMSRTAVSMGGVEYANPDVKAATNAVKTMAELMGLMVQKHEHAHVVASYEAMPSADKAKWLRSKAAELLEEADRLDGVVRVQADASDDA
jgi:phosphoribosyl-dephospho-CoA transferase